MRNLKAKDFATPLAEYTNLPSSATLQDAIDALERAIRGQSEHPVARPRDFAVMVIDEHDRVIGRLVVWDLLAGLETAGVTRVDSLSMIDDFGAWSHVSHLVARAREVKIRELVRSLHKDEFIDENETMDQAAARFVRHRFFSLIVTRNGQPVGVLRVVDVFSHICSLLHQLR
jgi:hypothetical protein